VLRKLLVAAAASLIVWSALPASAIVNGQPDDGEHPYVGEIMYFIPEAEAWFVCTGTLVSPTVVVTAGHCAYGVGMDGESTIADGGSGSGGNDIWVNFDETPAVDAFTGYEAGATFLNENGWIRGTAHPHDEFATAPFIFHDLGVVIVEPVEMDLYGQIAPLDYLDEEYAQGSRGGDVFEVVGYGLEGSRPFVQEGGHTRRKAEVKLNSLNSLRDTAAFISNNSGAVHQGGTCFGDSGGPILDGTDSNLIVAVQSFALGPRATCSGLSGAYRIDQPDDLAFLAGFGIEPSPAS
jgi:V8-like Glu-specific endopeptidase